MIKRRIKEEPTTQIPPPLPFADPHESREVPTCKRELLAWWMLSFANEPCSTVALGLSFSVLLEGLTKAVGHLPGQPGVPCALTGPCVAFSLGGWEVSTSSFSLYVTGFARLIPMILFIVVGPLADYCCWRKRMLIGYTAAGSIASILALTVFTPKLFWLAAILAVVVRSMLSVAVLVKNGYLPVLVKYDPRVLAEREGSPEQEAVKEALFNRLSTRSSIFGNLAAFLMILIATGVNWFANDWFFKEQVLIAITGVWWLGISAWSFCNLRSRRGRPVPRGKSVVALSLRKLGRTLTRIRHLPYPFIYILMSVLLSAAYLTADAVLGLAARNELRIPPSLQTIALLIRPVAALVGNVVFLKIRDVTGMSTRNNFALIILLYALGIVLPLVGLFSPTFGLRSVWEYLVLDFWYSFLTGPLSSVDRVVLAGLVPGEDISEFYALHGIGNRLGGVIGPLITGAIINGTGEVRYAKAAILAALLISLPILLWGINMNRAKRDISKFRSMEAMDHE